MTTLHVPFRPTFAGRMPYRFSEEQFRRLRDAGIVTDVRGTRLRLGFGLYHNADDVDRLVSRLRTLPD